MKRVLSLMAALIVCTSSSFAWNAESFIGDGSAEFQPYSFDPVVDDPAQVPMLMSMSPSTFAVEDSGSYITLSGDDLFSSLSVNENIAMLCRVYHDEYEINTGQSVITVPAFTELRPYPLDGLPVSINNASANWQYRTEYFVVSETQNGGVCTDFGGIVSDPLDGASPDMSITYDLDLSSLGRFYTFGLAGLLDSQATGYPALNGGAFGNATQLDVLVNGALVQSFFANDAGKIDFGSFTYDSTDAVTSLSFKVFYPAVLRPYDSTSRRIYTDIRKSSTMSLTVLTGNSALVGDINNAQGSINDHNAIESEWTGSMTENFEALDLSSFSFPSDLVAAFALITGIFNDLWNGMGEYKVIYVFPLTLGVVLLLIGRISKFSGRGSSRAGKGDGSA